MTPTPQDSTQPAHSTVSRRRLFGVAGAGALAGVSGVAGWGIASARDDQPAGGPLAYAFHGEHQAGIVTPAQDRLHFAAFDVTSDSRESLIELLEAWTVAAVAMTAGELVGGGAPQPYDAPPQDTGEAQDLDPAGLTITFGFGPTLFEKDGVDRFGLRDRQPEELRRLPHFPADNLDEVRSDGDLCIQACANDPQVAVHAIRNLSRIGFGTVSMRWAQLGFGRTSSTSTTQATPRNLFGFKDGTANLHAEEPEELSDHVWVQPGDDPAADWLAGGSYLVARRISMRIETWDRTSLREQESLIGRDRVEGAPLSGGTEFTEPDFALQGRSGPIMPMDSHVRLAHPAQNNNTKLLRRGYNFTDGADALGRLDAGLFFIAFVREPLTRYVPMQTVLSRDDALMEYLEHTGSGLWAVPPGIAQGHYVGQALFT
ncbi:iron uptake transporter deferrochelatase/peroxidase subunit [Tessaracoccus antarcticus]|uniref:Deferrochelatase n=1 Tax=Tessaracoccus antarcticus TaxID=2479848 RepID=A0A3M0GK23_9ACTN|nr:iron uptake transporter deferrochelatase/peroxidase subunit [Tessaracoccus antarcticus]RMB61973.1 deferrochelatase/peroxidase EfeB [Tessaracoccus antarcticus]